MLRRLGLGLGGRLWPQPDQQAGRHGRQQQRRATGDDHQFGVEAAGRGSGGMDFAIAPGEPDRSFLIYRLESTEPGIAMPELGRSTVHKEGAALLRQWIAEMPKASH